MERTNSTTATTLTKKQLKALDRITNRAPGKSRPPFFVRLGSAETNAICFTDGYSAVLLPMDVKPQLDEYFGAHEYTDFRLPDNLTGREVLRNLLRLDPSTKPTKKYSELTHGYKARQFLSTRYILESMEDTRDGVPYTHSGLFDPVLLHDVFEAVGKNCALWLGGKVNDRLGPELHSCAYLFPEDGESDPDSFPLPFGFVLPVNRHVAEQKKEATA